MLTQLSTKQCVGALFSLDTSGGNGPAWIVGDTFLKNVYSVFRYSPASVGFASLSVAATELAQEGGNLPTPTVGAHPIVATGGTLPLRWGLSLPLSSVAILILFWS